MRQEIFEAVQKVFSAIEQSLEAFSKNSEQVTSLALLYDTRVELRNAFNSCQKSIAWIDDCDLPNDKHIRTIKYIANQYDKTISLEENKPEHLNKLIESLRHLNQQIPSIASVVIQKNLSKEFNSHNRIFHQTTAEWHSHFFQNPTVIDGYIEKTSGLPLVKNITIHSPSSNSVNYLCVDIACYYKYIEQNVGSIQFYIFESFQFNRQYIENENQSLSLMQWPNYFLTTFLTATSLQKFDEQLSEAKKISDIDKKEIALYQLFNFYSNNETYRVAILETLIEVFDQYNNHLTTMDIDTTEQQKTIMDKIKNVVHRLPLNYQKISEPANITSIKFQDIYNLLKTGLHEKQTEAWGIFSNLQPLPKTMQYTCPHLLALWNQYKALFLLLDIQCYHLKQWMKAPENSSDLNFPHILHIYPNGNTINFYYKKQNAIQELVIDPENSAHYHSWIEILNNLKKNIPLTNEQSHFIFQQLADEKIYRPNRLFEDQTVSEALQFFKNADEILRGFDNAQANLFSNKTLKPFQILVEKGSEAKNKTSLKTLRNHAENEANQRIQQLNNCCEQKNNYSSHTYTGGNYHA